MPDALARLVPSEQVVSFYVLPGLIALALIVMLGWAVFSGGRGE